MKDLGAMEIEEVAKLFSVSEETIRREIKDGKLKTIPIRRSIRVTKRSIAEYQQALEQAVERSPSFTNRYV